MKRLLAGLMLAAALTARGQGTSEPIDAIYPFDLGVTGGFFTNTAGWTFQPTVGLAVTQLGFINALLVANNPLTMTVGLWADDGTLLASTNVYLTNSLVNGVNYQDVPTVSLQPMQTYHIAAYTSNSVYFLNTIIPGESGFYVPGSGIDSNSITWAENTNGFGLPFGQAGNHIMPAGATFRYVVPEPTVTAFLALSGFALLCWLRRPRAS